MKRIIAVLALLAPLATGVIAAQADDEIAVYRTPTCGCCTNWEEHLEANGFSVEDHVLPDLSDMKRDNGVTPALASCHTAFVQGYVIEGHVPAADIARLLEEKPAVAGLAVPGMPIGSPGMEGRYPETYRVLSFDRAGKVETFATHVP
jgi:hypothetical protein